MMTCSRMANSLPSAVIMAMVAKTALSSVQHRTTPHRRGADSQHLHNVVADFLGNGQTAEHIGLTRFSHRPTVLQRWQVVVRDAQVDRMRWGNGRRVR